MRAIIEESTRGTHGDDATATYALTRPKNGPSHAVLERFHFERQDGQPTSDALGNPRSDENGPIYLYKFPSGSTLERSQQLWRREAGLQLPRLSDAVYLGRTTVDRTEMPPPPQMSRNSLCFCGSGKKYKKCCEPGAQARSSAA